jgi:hypothetical protein
MAHVKQPDDTIKTPPEHPDHQDQLLDEAILESFPASDPVSISFDRPARAQSTAADRGNERR